jgi:glycosyltransferase involved in cell wall biosynthesis
MEVLEKKAFNDAKYVFGRTDWDFRVSKFMSPQVKYFHCNEIMRDEFYFASWKNRNANQIVIYTTSNDYPYKGIDQIYELNERIYDSYPDLNILFNIAGVDNESLCIKALNKIKYKNRSRVHLLGNLSACDIVNNMLNSDIFLYTSLIENGCNAVQEAMLVGMPIVCTAAGGLTTTIENNITGKLVQPGDLLALSSALFELINDNNLAVQLGTNAREIALNRHDKNTITSKVLDAYKYISGKNINK